MDFWKIAITYFLRLGSDGADGWSSAGHRYTGQHGAQSSFHSETLQLHSAVAPTSSQFRSLRGCSEVAEAPFSENSERQIHRGAFGADAIGDCGARFTP